MRHGNKNNALGRKKAHRDALLSNLAVSLISHKRIETTLAKARALRRFVEPIITRSKSDSTHSRRMVFADLQSKEATTALFRDVAPKVAERAGGYTRIIKLGRRRGDNAEMVIIELVGAPDGLKAKKDTTDAPTFMVLSMPNSLADLMALMVSPPALARPRICALELCACNR